MNTNIQPSQLEALQGRTLTYPELCKELNVPVKSGESRKIFFDKLKLCCKIEQVGRKYKIDEIYDASLFCDIHGNNKFQIYIDQLIMEAFRKNQYQPIYLSKTEMFLELGLVNHNYKIAKNKDAVRLLGDRYNYLLETVPEIAAILGSWVNQRVRSLHNRKIILYSSGYRLIKKIIYNRNIIYVKENLAPNSEKEKLAMKAVYNARTRALPEPLWNIEWIPDSYMSQYLRELKKEVIATFGIEYDTIVPVTVLRSTEHIIESNLQNCKQILNGESMRKIQSTKRLNFLTGNQREQVTHEIIDLSADINYSALITELKKKK